MRQGITGTSRCNQKLLYSKVFVRHHQPLVREGGKEEIIEYLRFEFSFREAIFRAPP